MHMVELHVGDVVAGKYIVRRRVAEGGMGVVWEAEQQLGTAVRRVAIKTLHANLSADASLRARFEREVATVCRLEHPNVIHVYDYGTAPEGYLYIVMEYVQGASIAHELNRLRFLPLARVSHVVEQVCGALAEAHSLGIVHRDLKPDNLMLTERAGIKDFLKVLDFGIAKSGRESLAGLTRAGAMLGTPPYMSPEQFLGVDVGPQSDVYSLGVVLYEMLSGALPFEAESPWAWARLHMEARPQSLALTPDGAALPAGVVEVVMRCLNKRPNDRPKGMQELCRMFLAVSGGPQSRGSTPYSGDVGHARTESTPVVLGHATHSASAAEYAPHAPRGRTSLTPAPPDLTQAPTQAHTGPSAWESPVIPVPAKSAAQQAPRPGAAVLVASGGAALLVAGGFAIWGHGGASPAPSYGAAVLAPVHSDNVAPAAGGPRTDSPSLSEPVEFNRPLTQAGRPATTQATRPGAAGPGTTKPGVQNPSGSDTAIGPVTWPGGQDLTKIFGPGAQVPLAPQPQPQPQTPPQPPLPQPKLPVQPALPAQSTLPAQPTLQPSPARGPEPPACQDWRGLTCNSYALGINRRCDELRPRCPSEFR